LIGFAMAACGNVNRPGPLILSGQLFEIIDDAPYVNDTFNTILTSAIGGEGTVTNGYITFTIGTPDTSYLQSIEYLFQSTLNPADTSYTNVAFSVAGARAAFLSHLDGKTEDGNPFVTQRVGIGNVDGAVEVVMYLFVDRDVTITAEGRADTENNFFMFDNIELRLQRGWNALYYKASLFEFPFVVTLEIIDRSGFPYDELVWLR